MKKEKTKITNAIFMVTQESSCPFYDLGDELKIENSTLSISPYKPVCLYLAKEIKKIVTTEDNVSKFTTLNSRHLRSNSQQSQFDCGGCTGLIKFKFKQDKEYATLQMKLLMESEEKRKKDHLAKYYHLIRPLEIFAPLENDALKDFITFLEFKSIPPQKVILEKSSPGTHLYLIISGEAEVFEESGQKGVKMNSGEIFGEMSLLSGEPHDNSYHSITVVQVALLSIKNFRRILKEHPALQIFLFKLLIDRVQKMALKSGNISSGMTGDLDEIPVVDLMQLLNSSQKTGCIDISSDGESAQAYFHEGEIIRVCYNQLPDKEALFSVLGIKRGNFTYTRDISEEYKDMLPIGGFMGLMMEGIQRFDEESE